MAFFFQAELQGYLVAAVIIAILVGIGYLNIKATNQRKKTLEDAKTGYYSSLEESKKRPTDPDLRQRTLELGRTYSNLTRNSQGVTIFDEVALSNDIGAACAGATTAVAFNHQRIAANTPSIEERLRKLDDLKIKSLISDDEYHQKREDILKEI